MALDWRTVFMMLPKRRFSAAELQRAIPDPPSLSLKVAVAINVIVPVVGFTWAFGGAHRLAFGAVLLLIMLVVVAALALAWRDPGHRIAHGAYVTLPLALGLGAGIAAKVVPGLKTTEVVAIALIAGGASLALWFAIVYRHKYVEMRLAELDERERRVDMARQLAQAQIQPHFLFNSLASLQHWVRTRDERAAPLLDALTGFLRATLPLFDRPMLRVVDEAQAAREYLAVMQLRLGDRLAWSVAIDEGDAAQALLPPGLLLTLVENAIEHGVQRTLAGAEVRVSAQVHAGRLCLAVHDTGPGPARASADGVGLSNARARLAQAFGDAATLTVQGPPAGGCVARIECPVLLSLP